MVVIHIKKTEVDQFLYNTTIAASGEEVITDLTNIWNKRILLRFLADAAEQLAKHGPSKPEAERGLEENEEKVEKGEHYNKDPTGYRTGNAPKPELASVIMRTCEEARNLVSKEQVARKHALTMAELKDKEDNIRGAVMMAYPGGLPDHDPVHLMLEGKEDFAGTQASLDILDPATSTLWWAGKEFHRDQTVGDRVGKNEKTKVIARLQKKGGGPPAREPAINEEERKAMMHYFFKKQEEAKAAAEADDDSYLESQWADPRGLKRSLLGAGNVSWKPVR